MNIQFLRKFSSQSNNKFTFKLYSKFHYSTILCNRKTILNLKKNKKNNTREVSNGSLNFNEKNKENFINSRKKNKLQFLKVLLLSSLGGFVLSYIYGLDDILKFDIVEPGSKEEEKYLQDEREKMLSLHIVKKLKNNNEFFIVPLNHPGLLSSDQSAISSVLIKPGLITLPPMIFFNGNTKETVSIYHLGPLVCGIPFITHGGLIASLLKDSATITADLVTRKLHKISSVTINYKMPTFSNRFIIVKSKISPDDPTLVESLIETPHERVLVRSTSSIAYSV